MKIMFLLCDRVKDSYGITSGLRNSAQFVVSFLREQGHEVEIEAIPDANSIDRVTTKFDPDIVIIEALWVPPAKFLELLKYPRHAKRSWVVRVHSKAPFLANEGMATAWIRDYVRLDAPQLVIAPNTEELTEQLQGAFPTGQFIYLPNIYHFDKPNVSYTIPKSRDIVDVGCFGAIRPMKNTFQQALAALEFANQKNLKLRFHINATRLEQKGEPVLKNLRYLFMDGEHELVEHMWLHHKEFLGLASQMDIGMQVSFSESFNIVSADFAAVKVPIVVSDDIEWMPWVLKTSPTSHVGMVRALDRAYGCPNVTSTLQSIYLKIYNATAKSTWLKNLVI